MAQQTTSGGKRAPRGRSRAATGEKPRRSRTPQRDSAGDSGRAEVLEPDVDEDEEFARRGQEPGSRNELTISGELASIVRQAAIEVLGPIARNATTHAARYAVRRGPALANDAIVPRLKETLGPRIQEAGGAGALAKDALSSVSGAREELLSKVGIATDRWLPVLESVDVAVPLETAYSQFTQFEDFPEFAPTVTSVEQVDDAHLVWHLRLWGLSREWEVEIIEQRPNERIAWKSLGGTGTTGVVTFHRLSDRLTRIEVNVNLKPHGVLETTVAGFRVLRRAFRSGLNRFKAFVELREEETGAWLGRIDEGEVVEGNGARKSRARTRDSRESRDKKQVKKRAPRKRARREPDDEDESAYDEEEPEEYEEEEPEASEDDEEPDEEPEDEPTPRKRPVRRRPPARSGRQSRGRRQ